MKGVRLPLLAGFAMASVIADPISEAAFAVYDRAFPVIAARWQSIVLNDGRYAIQFSGVKNRDCQLVRVWAYDVSPDGIRTRLAAAREGAINIHLPVGRFAATHPWIVTPPPMGRLEVTFEHRCGSRIVITPTQPA